MRQVSDREWRLGGIYKGCHEEDQESCYDSRNYVTAALLCTDTCALVRNNMLTHVLMAVRLYSLFVRRSITRKVLCSFT